MNNTFLKLAFDKNCNNFNSIIKNSFNSSLKLKPEFENTNLKILNFNQPSLSSLLLHSKGNLNLLFQHRYKFCKKLDCFTCNFASNKHYINLNDLNDDLFNKIGLLFSSLLMHLLLTIRTITT